jgi:outer membrane biogenesis lipoprotein LolB
MFKKFLILVSAIFIISSCSNEVEKEADNLKQGAIVQEAEVEKYWIWEAWNKWEIEGEKGFNN